MRNVLLKCTYIPTTLLSQWIINSATYQFTIYCDLFDMRYQDIFEAVEKNDEAGIEKYFVEQKNLNLTNIDYRLLLETAAHVAASRGNANILKFLLNKKPDLVDAKRLHLNKICSDIFFPSIENGHLEVIRYLVENLSANISEKNTKCSGNTAIHIAAEYGHLPILKYFVEDKCGDADVLNEFNQSPVFLAAKNQHQSIVKYLVEKQNVNLTIVDYHRHNILYMAVTNGDLDLLKYVLNERNSSLDINWKDNFGHTILHRAVNLNKCNVLQYLVNEKKANINTVDIWHETPLHSASRQNHYEMCKFLIEHDADTEIQDDFGFLPVHQSKDLRIIKLITKASIKSHVGVRKVRKRVGRRAVESLGFNQVSVSDVWMRRAIGNSNSYPVVDSVDKKSIDINSHRFLNFLSLARMLIRENRPSYHQGCLILSRRRVLLGRMDPIAIDSIESVRVP